MSSEPKLPLKRVSVSAENFFSPKAGGSGPTLFGPVTPGIRGSIAREVQLVAKHFEASFTAYPRAAAVARVQLKDEAIAKSHRPLHLFERTLCPIVGVGELGELLVSVRPMTTTRLENFILSDATKLGEANISTIRRVEPFRVEAGPLESAVAGVAGAPEVAVKLRLFRHNDPAVDRELKTALMRILRAWRVQVEELPYATSLSIYRLRRLRPEHVTHLSDFVGTQSLGLFPEYRVVRPAATPVGKLNTTIFPPPIDGMDYPVVGIIDSGVDPANTHLRPWIAARENFVPVAERDYEHGTFVAGLVVHGRLLNHDDDRFPNTPCRIIDVTALPRTGCITEDQLVAILREVIPKYPHVRVWNMSLSGCVPCTDHRFSDLAVALDEIQSEHDVTFVLPAGNYQQPPLRAWPPTSDLGESDRICAPADSVRALTVGSIAHREAPSSCVRAMSPSPFTRRGPGPVFLPKPEISHFGGNCDPLGTHAQTGVLSVDGAGNLAESIGTSFASPPVAALLAHVQATPLGGVSALLGKALVVHSAVLHEAGLDARTVRYRGYGVPRDADSILSCESWQATLLFETQIRAGLDLQRSPFPIPPSLITAERSLRAEIIATLVYEPPLDSVYGAEYCRTNVDVSLGTYRERKGKWAQQRQVNPFPHYPRASVAEKKLVEHGFKWSPVKVYRRLMQRGIQGDVWRLAMMATDRSGVFSAPVGVALAITIADPERRAPVYNEVVARMNQLGWVATDVHLRPRARSRVA